MDTEGPSTPSGDGTSRAAKEGPSAPPGDDLERATEVVSGDEPGRAMKEGPSAPVGDELERAATVDPPDHDASRVRETFPRRLRLQRRREFLRVQRSGAKHHTRFFLVFVAPSMLRGRAPAPAATGPASAATPGLPATRLGVTVTRKVGKAVKRNRIKRLVREAFRREHHALPAGLDMVWVAKRDAVDSTFEAVVHDMRALAGRLRTPRGRGGPRSERTGAPSSSPPSARSR